MNNNVSLSILFILFLSSCDNNHQEQSTQSTQINANQQSCSTTQTITIRGNSMTGIFANADEILLQQDYYNCHQVKNGDIIVFHYDNKKVIKKVYAMAGDKLSYDKNGFILINDKPIKNIDSKFYKVDKVGKSYIDLASKVQMKNNIIPKGHYFVLGTKNIGGYDSRRFGLVGLNMVIGKVLLQK